MEADPLKFAVCPLLVYNFEVIPCYYLSISVSVTFDKCNGKRPLLVFFRCLKDVKSNVVSVHNAVNEHVGHLLAVCWTV